MPADKSLKVHAEWCRQGANKVLQLKVAPDTQDIDSFHRSHEYYAALKVFITQVNVYGAKVMNDAYVTVIGPKPSIMAEIPVYDESGSLS